MLQFPNIDPEIFEISLWGMSFALRWYALAYIVGIFLGWRHAVMLVNRPKLWAAGADAAAPMSVKQVEDLMTWMVLGIILGGRLGYVFFYNWAYFSENPVDIVKVWQGGMSFHGGVAGVLLGAAYFCWRNKISFIATADMIAVSSVFGLFLGRIANFINGELWGRPTDVSWAMVFPAAPDCPGALPGLCGRHPSQLYEAALEGIVLGAVLLALVWGAKWLRKPGRVLGVFLVGYAIARTIVELFRQPDGQFMTPDNPSGFVISLGDFGLTMGQSLSAPMLLIGLVFLLRRQKA